MPVDHHLTVTRAFGKYERGQRIEDKAEIAAILDGEHRSAVVKVAPIKSNAEATKPSAVTQLLATAKAQD